MGIGGGSEGRNGFKGSSGIEEDDLDSDDDDDDADGDDDDDGGWVQKDATISFQSGCTYKDK